MINQPYIKQYDESGKLLNPLSGKFFKLPGYHHKFENRSERRAKEPRKFNNRKGGMVRLQHIVYKSKKKKGVLLHKIISHEIFTQN